MLAVVGSPSFKLGSMPAAAVDAGGLAAGIARAAAAAGAQVQLIGKVGDDPAGEAVPIAALRAEAEAADRRHISLGEGATPPAPGLALEPADISLGLRYVSEF